MVAGPLALDREKVFKLFFYALKPYGPPPLPDDLKGKFYLFNVGLDIYNEELCELMPPMPGVWNRNELYLWHRYVTLTISFEFDDLLLLSTINFYIFCLFVLELLEFILYINLLNLIDN